MNVKSLNLGGNGKTSTIKLVGHPADIKAVYALLGGYNEVARKIDVNDFHEVQKQFKEVVQEISDKLLLG